MNQKKVKALRKEALIQAVEQNLEYVDYDFKTFKKVYQSLDGKYHPYQVYTCTLKDCERKILKALKKEFKEGK